MQGLVEAPVRNSDERLVCTDKVYDFLLKKGLLSEIPASSAIRLSGIKPIASKEYVVKVQKEVDRFADLLASAVEEGVRIRESRDFTKYFLQQSGFETSSSFLDELTTEDLVEGYTLDKIQIFRNLTYMQYCGYTLSEVLCYEWPDLYERSSITTEALFECIVKVMESKNVIAINIPTHLMKERFSASRRIHSVSLGKMAPLFKAGEMIGVILSSRASIIDKEPSRHDLRFI